MKCLILAAGYATRLYPLTENFPKPLLKVGEKTILDWLIEDIAGSGVVDEFIVISNHKFASIFERWAEDSEFSIRVVDDMTESNETRLGAVCDIKYALDKLGIDDDLLVIAGDNVLDFSLSSFISYARDKGTSCIMRYYEKDTSRLRKCGIVCTDGNDLVTDMQEKPENPRSNWCCPPFYYYIRQDAGLIGQGIAEGCGTDAPGSYIAWLCGKTEVHAMEMPGSRYDIGNFDSYRKVQESYKGITK